MCYYPFEKVFSIMQKQVSEAVLWVNYITHAIEKFCLLPLSPTHAQLCVGGMGRYGEHEKESTSE